MTTRTRGRRGVFEAAAGHFADLVRSIADDRWDEPGLGDWTVRDLVGHTSRSLTTVSTYLRTEAAYEDVSSAVEYYVRMRDYAAGMGADAIVERGRQAGRDLGADPAAAIDHLLARALDDLDGVDDPLIEVIGGLGIRLSSYLPAPSNSPCTVSTLRGLSASTATRRKRYWPTPRRWPLASASRWARDRPCCWG